MTILNGWVIITQKVKWLGRGYFDIINVCVHRLLPFGGSVTYSGSDMRFSVNYLYHKELCVSGRHGQEGTFLFKTKLTLQNVL